jgi:hypothetical protein
MKTANDLAAALNAYEGSDHYNDIICRCGIIDWETTDDELFGIDEAYICDDGITVSLSGGRWVAANA